MRTATAMLPHWFCLRYDGPLGWTIIGCDGLIGLDYFAIAVILFGLVRLWLATPLAAMVQALLSVPIRVWLLLAVGGGMFILSCGVGHWVDVATMFTPIYLVTAVNRVVTAVASTATWVGLALVSRRVRRHVRGA